MTRAERKRAMYEALRAHGVPMGRDYHTLSYAEAEICGTVARMFRYKSRHGNGSTGRMFYSYANS